MKTKEEILETETRHEKFELGTFTKVYELAALSAMSIYAKEIAIGFIKWALEGEYLSGNWDGDVEIAADYTEEELFNEYLKSIEA